MEVKYKFALTGSIITRNLSEYHFGTYPEPEVDTKGLKINTWRDMVDSRRKSRYVCDEDLLTYIKNLEDLLSSLDDGESKKSFQFWKVADLLNSAYTACIRRGLIQVKEVSDGTSGRATHLEVVVPVKAATSVAADTVKKSVSDIKSLTCVGEDEISDISIIDIVAQIGQQAFISAIEAGRKSVRLDSDYIVKIEYK